MFSSAFFQFLEVLIEFMIVPLKSVTWHSSKNTYIALVGLIGNVFLAIHVGPVL